MHDYCGFERVYNTIIKTKDGVFEVYSMNPKTGEICAYICFPKGETNYSRMFKEKDVTFYRLRRKTGCE